MIWLELWQIKTRLDLGPACLGLGLKRLDLIGALVAAGVTEVGAFILDENLGVERRELLPYIYVEL